MARDKREIIDQLGVENIVAKLREAMGPEIMDICDRLGVDTEAIIRYSPLGDKFRDERARLNLSIKEVAAQLKVPQYRIKAIEEGHFREINLEVFHKYCRLLKMDDYVADWCRKNAELAGELGLEKKD